MAKRQEQREAVIQLIGGHILKTGLSQTSLRQLAKAANTSDRMLLYYFKNKTEILAAAMEYVAIDLSDRLAVALPDQRRVTPSEMVEVATKLTQSKLFRPHMRLWLECTAASIRREPPFTEMTRQIATGFLGWIEDHLDISELADRRSTAAMIFAITDGLAVLEVCTDLPRAKRAAARMVSMVR